MAEDEEFLSTVDDNKLFRDKAWLWKQAVSDFTNEIQFYLDMTNTVLELLLPLGHAVTFDPTTGSTERRLIFSVAKSPDGFVVTTKHSEEATQWLAQNEKEMLLEWEIQFLVRDKENIFRILSSIGENEKKMLEEMLFEWEIHFLAQDEESIFSILSSLNEHEKEEHWKKASFNFMKHVRPYLKKDIFLEFFFPLGHTVITPAPTAFARKVTYTVSGSQGGFSILKGDTSVW